MQTQKLLDRIAALVRIDLDDLLMEQADPQEAVAHWRAEMDSGLAQAQDALAVAITQERLLERQWQSAQALSQEWDARTDAALQAGDDEQARAALRRKASYQKAAEELRTALDRKRQLVSEMKASVSALQAKIQDARPEGLTKPFRSGGKTP